jgi:hypothetical protein
MVLDVSVVVVMVKVMDAPLARVPMAMGGGNRTVRKRYTVLIGGAGPSELRVNWKLAATRRGDEIIKAHDEEEDGEDGDWKVFAMAQTARNSQIIWDHRVLRELRVQEGTEAKEIGCTSWRGHLKVAATLRESFGGI